MTAEDSSVSRFREYLRIKSVQPNPDYDGCIAYILKEAQQLDLDSSIVKLESQLSVVVLSWRGSEPLESSLMLNSHMDVVPVDQSKWKCDAFAAHKDAEGNIYGRGTQDMKSTGVQYLEAIRRLKAQGFKPRRTIHVTFVPDEELGSAKGMQLFVKTPEFKALNVGLELDEGGACPTDEFIFFYAERVLWQVEINVKGNTGHALHFIENTAAEKARKIINTFLDFRTSEKSKLGEDRTGVNLGTVTTCNLTLIQGGVQANVIPSEIKLTFDFRITPKWSQKEAEDFIHETCMKAGSDITYKFIVHGPIVPATSITDDNKWWTTFKTTADKMKIKLVPMICPGATDARFLRELGISAFGFSPMNNTPILLHDNNEFLNEGIFLKGITIYENLLRELANVQ